MDSSGRDEGDANKNQNHQPRRYKEVENQVAPPHQPPPPQKCPRCESLNTKFCYYNNYNLAQPRYFCKGCRRYWTHGGTLRNVPVGGGCRKGRRSRNSPISCGGGESSRSRTFRPPQPLQPPQQQPQVDFPNIANMAALLSGIANLPASSQQSLRSISWAHPGGMFGAFDGTQMPPLSSQTQGMNPPISIGAGGTNNLRANLPIFPGFDFSSMKSQHTQSQSQSQQLQIRDQPRQFDGIGNLSQPVENMVLPAGNLNSWTPGDNTANASASNSHFRNSISSGPSAASFNPNEWPNIPDYDASE